MSTFRTPGTLQMDSLDAATVVPSTNQASASPHCFPAEWRDRRIAVETAWDVEISTARETGVEERRTLTTRPRIAQESAHVAMSIEESQILQMAARAWMRSGTIPWPLFSDPMSVLGWNGGLLRLTVNTTENRRLFVGQRVWIMPPRGDAVLSLPTGRGMGVLAQVTALTSNTIDIDGVPAGVFPTRGWCAFPSIDAFPVLDLEQRQAAAGLSDLVVEALEVDGPSALPAQSGEDVSADFGYHTDTTGRALPILDVPHNWVRTPTLSNTRPGEVIASGRSQVVATDGPRARVGTQVRANLDRAGLFRLLRFFDSRRGRTLPFWFPANTTWWAGIGASGGQTSIRVPARGFFADLADLYAIYIVGSNGSTQVREILGTVDVGNDEWALQVAALDATGGTAACINPCYRARFSRSSLRELWNTADNVDVSFDVVELVEEDDACVTV